jgi:hypothetical protein
MASLAARKPKTEKKAVSPLERMRASTNWDANPRPTGFAPLYNASLADAFRLADGAAFKILMLVWNRSFGRIVPKGKPFSEVTGPLAVSEIAELVHCDERTAQRELNGLVERKVIGRDKVGNGLFEFRPLYKTWASLPDYKPGPVSEPAAESDDEPETGDPAQADKQTTHVTKAPVRVTAGKKSKAFKVDCGVSALQFDVRQLDADCSAMVKDGVLLVTLEPKWNAGSGVEGLKKQKGIEENRRQICRSSPSETEGKASSGNRRTSGESAVKHPRAEELSALFDGPIYQSCKKTLSGDPVALKKACEAIADTPHEYLVDFLSERASRKILPLHAPSICSEALHNWQKSGELPAQKKEVTREEINKIIERETAELAAKRAALKKGRVA